MPPRDSVAETVPSDDLDVVATKDVKRRTGDKAPNGIWWGNGLFVGGVHVLAFLSIFIGHPLKWQTLVLGVLFYWLSLTGITAGYHRMWSHRAYKGSLSYRILMGVLGTMATQGSIRWWSIKHRIHHRFTDTKFDPYDSTKGFWFSHIGWLFVKPPPSPKALDTTDLDNDPVVALQHKYYVPLALFVAFVMPTLIASLWGDALGGYIYVALISKVFVWNATFCINSFAHLIGNKDFSREISARGNIICAILTNGEGYHNFHHEFPKDYRNGIYFWDYDPTKWVINFFSTLGMAHSLTVTPDEDIKKARYAVFEKELADMKKDLDFGPSDDKLPSMTLRDVTEACTNEGKRYSIWNEYVIDLASFEHVHPGGQKILKVYVGKDLTGAFLDNSINIHSEAAKVKAKSLRIARLVKD